MESLILPKYVEYYRSQTRYAILYGGAGSGKSTAAAQKFIFRAIEEPGARLLVIRKHRTTLRESVWPLLTDSISRLGLQEQITAHVTNFTVTFPNGSQIICRGLDDPEKIKSIQGISSIWIEEATELKEDDFAQLELRIRGQTPGYKQYTLTFNPTDQSHWLHNRFFSSDSSSQIQDSCNSVLAPLSPKAGEGLGVRGLAPSDQASQSDNANFPAQALGPGSPAQTIDSTTTPPTSHIPHPASDLLIIHTTADDNPLLDQAYRHHLSNLLHTNENFYRIYAQGLWGYLRRGGTYYKHFSIPRHVGAATYNPHLPLHFSFDFNLHPYLTCTVWQVEGREVRQIGEVCLESPRNSTLEMGKELMGRYAGHTAGVRIYGDPNGHQIGLHGAEGIQYRYSHYQMLARELSALNPSIEAPKSARPVAERGIFINAVLEERVDTVRLLIDPGCRNSIEDLQGVLEEPDGTKKKALYTHPATGVRCERYGHCSDAMDYFLCVVLREEYRGFFRLKEEPVPDVSAMMRAAVQREAARGRMY